MAISNCKLRRKITIDHSKIDDDLINYPVMVKLYKPLEGESYDYSDIAQYNQGDIVKNANAYYKSTKNAIYGNVSSGKIFDNITVDVSRPASWVTDGNTVSANYVHGGLSVTGSTNPWITLDLGEYYNVDTIKVWHYYLDGRTYYNPETQVSEDGITWETVSDGIQYAETSSGKTWSFAPKKIRYMRDKIEGSTANTSNHWVEIQVFGSLLLKEPGVDNDWQDDWTCLGIDFDFSKVRDDGYDIEFADATSMLPFEREYFTKPVNSPAIADYGTGSGNATANFYNNKIYIEDYVESRRYHPTYNSSYSTTYYSGNVYNFNTIYKTWTDLLVSKGLSSTQHNPGNHPITSTTTIVYSGTNTYTMSSNISEDRWVWVSISGGAYTTNVAIGNFKVRIGGTLMFLSEAVSQGYIEPLVLIGDEVWSSTYLWVNTQTLYNSSTTLGSKSYPRIRMLFKLKNGAELSGVSFYANQSFSTRYGDGLQVRSWTPGVVDLSLSPYVENISPGKGIFHVKIPQLSSDSDTKFYMNYSNPEQTIDGQNPSEVWDDNFVMVQHMGDSLVDSTGNGNDGTNYGTTVVDGLNGKARQEGNISGNNITIPISAIPTGSQVTVTLVSKVTIPSGRNNIIMANNSSGYRCLGAHMPYDNAIYWDTGIGSTSYDRVTKSITTELSEFGVWHLTKNASTNSQKIFRNGSLWHNGSGSANIGTPSTAKLIETDAKKTGLILDEVRISNIARSDAWIKADDYNLRQYSLLSVGIEEPVSRMLYKINGEWKYTKGYLKVDGIWKSVLPYTKFISEWK